MTVRPFFHTPMNVLSRQRLRYFAGITIDWPLAESVFHGLRSLIVPALSPTASSVSAAIAAMA
jgi:hypothetical protein